MRSNLGQYCRLKVNSVNTFLSNDIVVYVYGHSTEEAQNQGNTETLKHQCKGAYISL